MKDQEIQIESLKRQLSEAIKRIDELEKREHLDSELDNEFNEFYLAFENEYRGTNEDVREKLQAHLSAFKSLVHDTDSPILDIGCGRGEWLQILKENGFSNTHGIDSNSAMVNECSNHALSVEHSDAFDYLGRSENSYYKAITAMHIIEHMPFKKLMVLFKEIFRCLAPGGIALFETPNPRNLFVGSFTFHFDPTHLKPIPPTLGSFLAKYIGFEVIGIRPSNMHSDITEEFRNDPNIPQLLRDSFAAGLDYSLLIKKPEA